MLVSLLHHLYLLPLYLLRRHLLDVHHLHLLRLIVFRSRRFTNRSPTLVSLLAVYPLHLLHLYLLPLHLLRLYLLVFEVDGLRGEANGAPPVCRRLMSVLLADKQLTLVLRERNGCGGGGVGGNQTRQGGLP